MRSIGCLKLAAQKPIKSYLTSRLQTTARNERLLSGFLKQDLSSLRVFVKKMLGTLKSCWKTAQTVQA